MKQVLTTLIDQMEQIHHGKGWIGVNFEKQLKGISEIDFFDQINGMHSIAELISHLTTWRFETILKVKTGKGSITDSDPSNWKTIEVLKDQGKEKILLNYNESLLELLKLLKKKNDTFLAKLYYDTDFKNNYPYSFLIQGMLQHDIYHLGQIGLLIKCLKLNSDK